MAYLKQGLICAGLLASLGGCATVSVYEPGASAEISLVGPGADLKRASEAYRENAQRKGLASGEASLGGIAERFLGVGETNTSYVQRVGVGKASPETVVVQVRSDAREVTQGLEELNRLAAKVSAKGPPTGGDVTQFELALIHAGQARDSLSEALEKLNAEAGASYDVAAELKPLDAVLSRSRKIADDLASAHAKASAASSSTVS